MQNEIIIDIKGIEKAYDLGAVIVRALRGVDLAIEKSEFVAIMGASGSGKSTLLNVLGCLDQPTAGSYLLGGRDVAQLDDNELSEIRGSYLGFIFQSYNLIPQLTVLENIQVPLFYQGKTMNECRELCTELGERVGLADRLDHRPMQLSGGQQQRVAIARSLTNDPLLILADEPTGNLDSQTETEVLDIITHLNENGKTIVMVTHDDHVAERAHRVLHMKDGCIDREIKQRQTEQQKQASDRIQEAPPASKSKRNRLRAG
jgi:putative ABC transport system ATP-binding protein